MLGRGSHNNWHVHVLVARAFHGPKPIGMEVLHLNHDPADNRPQNLVYGTRSENMKMDYAAGRRVVPAEWIYSNNGKRKNYLCNIS